MIVMKMTKNWKETYGKWKARWYTEKMLFTIVQTRRSEKWRIWSSDKTPPKECLLEIFHHRREFKQRFLASCFQIYFTSIQNPNMGFQPELKLREMRQRKKRRKQKSGCQLNSQLTCTQQSACQAISDVRRVQKTKVLEWAKNLYH